MTPSQFTALASLLQTRAGALGAELSQKLENPLKFQWRSGGALPKMSWGAVNLATMPNQPGRQPNQRAP